MWGSKHLPHCGGKVSSLELRGKVASLVWIDAMRCSHYLCWTLSAPASTFWGLPCPMPSTWLLCEVRRTQSHRWIQQRAEMRHLQICPGKNVSTCLLWDADKAFHFMSIRHTCARRKGRDDGEILLLPFSKVSETTNRLVPLLCGWMKSCFSCWGIKRRKVRTWRLVLFYNKEQAQTAQLCQAQTSRALSNLSADIEVSQSKSDSPILHRSTVSVLAKPQTVPWLSKQNPRVLYTEWQVR